MKEDGSSVIRRSSVRYLSIIRSLFDLFLVKKSVVAESPLDGGRVARNAAHPKRARRPLAI